MPVLVELKACERLTHAHRAQVIHYMKAAQIQRALLMNFGGPALQFERMVMGWDGWRTSRSNRRINPSPCPLLRPPRHLRPTPRRPDARLSVTGRDSHLHNRCRPG